MLLNIQNIFTTIEIELINGDQIANTFKYLIPRLKFFRTRIIRETTLEQF